MSIAQELADLASLLDDLAGDTAGMPGDISDDVADAVALLAQIRAGLAPPSTSAVQVSDAYGGIVAFALPVTAGSRLILAAACAGYQWDGATPPTDSLGFPWALSANLNGNNVIFSAIADTSGPTAITWPTGSLGPCQMFALEVAGIGDLDATNTGQAVNAPAQLTLATTSPGDFGVLIEQDFAGQGLGVTPLAGLTDRQGDTDGHDAQFSGGNPPRICYGPLPGGTTTIGYSDASTTTYLAAASYLPA